ncbi:MAG: phage tail protein [Clostridiales bacterium]|nr:phage tail protein [Clostridiales bacterium]
MADTNKIKYGIKNCYYAVATISTTGTATYSTPVALPGAVSLSLDAQGDTGKFYADNIVYFTSVANNGYEGDLELARVPDSFLTDCLGYIRDGNSVLIEDAGAAPVHFALMFQFEGDVNAKRTVMYNCVASRPSVEGSTKEETIEPQTETISITATTIYNSVLDKDVVKASCTTTESTVYNGWLSAVYQTTST